LIKNKQVDAKNICETCTNPVDESSADVSCEDCHRIQMFRNDCPQYELSEYMKRMLVLSPFEFAR